MLSSPADALYVGVASVAKCWRQNPLISLSRGVVLSQSTFHLVIYLLVSFWDNAKVMSHANTDRFRWRGLYLSGLNQWNKLPPDIRKVSDKPEQFARALEFFFYFQTALTSTCEDNIKRRAIAKTLTSTSCHEFSFLFDIFAYCFLIVFRCVVLIVASILRALSVLAWCYDTWMWYLFLLACCLRLVIYSSRNNWILVSLVSATVQQLLWLTFL